MSFTTEVWNTKPATIASAKKATMPSSALPRNGELREEDDWTKVKDPKEKKRIQNRVAQRTYRHRMKARLGELQARLESHEGRRQGSVDAPADPSVMSATPPSNFTPKTIDTTIRMEGSPSPSLMAEHHHQQPMPQMMGQPSLYEQPVEDPENSLFPQAAHGLLNSPPTSQASPSANGLLSPPSQHEQQHDPRSGTKNEGFMMDCMRFQSQLLNRLNNLQQDAPFPAGYPVPSQMPQEQMNMTGFPAPETMEFAPFDPSVDMWKAESPVKMQQQQASPDSTYFQSLTPPTTSTATTMPAPLPETSSPAVQMPSKNASVDERFQCIMNQVEAAGFESFDAMATAYYTQTFSNTSPLADEQRLSRGRRLPQFVSSVHNATSQWSDWESKGFQEEILKTAESMLSFEGCDARQTLGTKVNALTEALDAGNMPASSEALMAMKHTVQEQLPNSWAMTMAMAGDSRPSWQSDRSNTALATTLLLNYAGRMPNEQLLRLVGACL